MCVLFLSIVFGFGSPCMACWPIKNMVNLCRLMLLLLQLGGLHSLMDLVWKMLVWSSTYFFKRVYSSESIKNKIRYLHFVCMVQINVQTQRGFVPVDERMRVVDSNGKLVSNFLFFFLWFYNVCGFYWSSSLNIRFLTCIVLVMQMEEWCLHMLQAHKEFLVGNSCFFHSDVFSWRRFHICLTLGVTFFAVVEQVCGNDHVLNHLSVPAACFTHPEISMVGLTEVEFIRTSYIIWFSISFKLIVFDCGLYIFVSNVSL